MKLRGDLSIRYPSGGYELQVTLKDQCNCALLMIYGLFRPSFAVLGAFEVKHVGATFYTDTAVLQWRGQLGVSWTNK